MLRPSSTSLPESSTKSTSSRSSPVPLNTSETTADIRSICCAPLQAARNSVVADAIAATLVFVMRYVRCEVTVVILLRPLTTRPICHPLLFNVKKKVDVLSVSYDSLPRLRSVDPYLIANNDKDKSVPIRRHRAFIGTCATQDSKEMNRIDFGFQKKIMDA